MRMAAKMVVLLALSNALIMILITLFELDHRLPHVSVIVIDSAFIALIASIVAYAWVVKPMNNSAQWSELFVKTLSNFDHGIVIINPAEGYAIEAVNQAFMNISMFKEWELVEKDRRYFKNRPEKDVVLQILSFIDQESLTWQGECCRKDGSIFKARFKKEVVTNSRGEGLRYLIEVDDIQAQVQSYMQSRLISKAMVHMQAPMLIADSHGSIEFVNNVFSDLFGYQPSDIIGANFISLFNEDDYITYVGIWEIIRQGKVWHKKTICHTKKRVPLDIKLIVTPVLNGNGDDVYKLILVCLTTGIEE